MHYRESEVLPATKSADFGDSAFGNADTSLLLLECRKYVAGEMIHNRAVDAALDDGTLVTVLGRVLPPPVEDKLVMPISRYLPTKSWKASTESKGALEARGKASKERVISAKSRPRRCRSRARRDNASAPRASAKAHSGSL